jgi:ATP-dependent helicase/nuclease subunit B
LEQLIETLIGWMGKQYEFDPRAVEVGFGLPGSQLPAWRLDLGEGRALLLRGRIDRVDLWRDPRADEALAVVIDYKSRARKFDPRKLHHGLELQLLAYLGVLRHLADPQGQFDAARLRPAGVFYVGLSGVRGAVRTRAEGLAGGEAARKEASQHAGRFDGDALDKFDNRGVSKGDQFKYAKNKDGAFSRRGNEAMGRVEFLALLDGVEGHLRRIGRSVYAGEVAASPYRINNEMACDFCDYRSICRFDPWREPYNVLRVPPKEKVPGPPEKRARKSTHDERAD